MGAAESKPDKDLLPVTTGTTAEFMAAVHKLWESLPLNWFFEWTAGVPTSA